MKKLRPSILSLLIILVWLLAACGSTTPNEATITIKEMAFGQSEITVKAGQPVTLRLVNRDGYAHAFDMDEFDIHTSLAANETAELLFTPEKPGRYPFYCSSPGHEMAGMVGTLIVEP
ncbi:MAG TPA: cupredoxin domain-containing protein [Chloroflexota bacterium]|nr:cupredoxin domain-containing protein [Chloroflexota bacterium]HUM71543.1 cupredoxin domain-containing protein [Chloroflexota bacterium]